MPKRIGHWAQLSLLLALGIALIGAYLQHRGLAFFWGGLLLAFGEAALVGGLADWFAVRALFVHPLGLPFPHTAVIPRNRRRITHEVSNLVLTEWLPLSVLHARVEAFDFVGAALLPLVETLRPRARAVLRDVGRELLDLVDPAALSPVVVRGIGGSLESERVRFFLADVLRHTCERHWLEPLLNDGIRHLQQWAGSPQMWRLLRKHLERASESYQNRGLARTLAFSVAELFGGLDLDGAATDLQYEMFHFLGAQLQGHGPMKQAVEEGLAGVEQRLRDDPQYLDDLRALVLQQDGGGSLASLIEAVLGSLRLEAQHELARDDSHLLGIALSFVDRWVARLRDDLELRSTVNAWCRRTTATLLERHHSLLGSLVEEQMNRSSDQALTALIESRVGEDLNWIRLNGTFVGGLIGVVLYVLFWLVKSV